MTARPRILAVDDGPDNLLLLEDLLGSEYEVLLASSGCEALEIARSLRPDLMLLDIGMPELDGYATCRAFRADPALRATKIILLSGRSMTAERLEGYGAGADDYVTKPFDREELLAKLRVFLRLKHVEEVARMRDDLFTLIAHETRTPLSVVMGALEMLGSYYGLAQGPTRELHEAAMANVARLQHLIDASATLGALRAGRLHLDAVPLAVRDLAARTASESRPVKAGVQVQVEMAQSPSLVVLGDPAHLPSVLRMVLEHAVERTPSGGSVELQIAEEHDEVVFRFLDRGPDLGVEDLRALFEPFDSRDVSHHTSHGGSGLRLALVREVVEQSGGRFEALARAQGGLCMMVRLPVAEAPRHAHERV